jgi:hypothetical protein
MLSCNDWKAVSGDSSFYSSTITTFIVGLAVVVVGVVVVIVGVVSVVVVVVSVVSVVVVVNGVVGVGSDCAASRTQNSLSVSSCGGKLLKAYRNLNEIDFEILISYRNLNRISIRDFGRDQSLQKSYRNPSEIRRKAVCQNL